MNNNLEKDFLLSGSLFGMVILLFIINIANASPAATWQADQPCGERLTDFQATELKACIRAYCATLPDHTQLCACEKEEANDEMAIEIERITTDGQKTPLIKTAMPFSFAAESLLLHRVNLTDSKDAQLLLGVMNSQSNGMGVQYWTVWAIDGSQVSKPIQIEDYGTMGFTTRAEHESRCQLLVTRWVSGWEPKRGDGLYIIGLWHYLVNNEFLPMFERPSVFRRYLSELEQQRNQVLYSQQKKPVLWYKNHTQPLIGPDLFKYQKE